MIRAAQLRLLAALLMVAAMALSAYYWSRLSLGHEQLRTDTLAQASTRASQLANAQSEHFEALIDGIDLALRHFRDARQLGRQEVVDSTIQTALGAFPKGALLNFSIVNASGHIEYTHKSEAEQVYVGGRDYFKFHQTAGRDQVFINKPLFSPTLKRWIIPITRPIHDEHQRFKGVAVILLSPEYLARSLAQLEMSSGDIATLLFNDGTYVARSHDMLAVLGKSLPPDRPFMAKQAPSQGVFRAQGQADGVARIFAWSRLQTYPLIINVGLDIATVLAPVEREVVHSRTANATGIGLLLVLTSLVSLLLLRTARQQHALLRGEAMLRSTLDATADGLLVVNQSGGVLSANRRFHELWRIPENLSQAAEDRQLLSHVLDQLSDPQGFQAVVAELYQTDAEHADTVNFKDGRVFDRYSCTFQMDGQRVRLWSFRDVTERSAAERARLDGEQRFREIFDAVNDAIFIHDAETGRILDVNQRMCEMYGCTRERALGSSADDLSAGRAPYSGVEALQRLQSVRDDGAVTFDWLARHRSGRTFWVEVSLRLAQIGGQTRILAVVRDHSERKRAEAQLRLAASVFAHSYEGILISNAHNKIVDVNPAFSRITGYPKDEVLGKNPGLLASGRHDRSFYTAMWASLAKNDFWSGEVWNRRKNGEVFAEMLSISVVRDESGMVQHHIAVFTDISLIKLHEVELGRIAHYDTLTGVPNRRLLADRLSQAIARGQRSGKPLAICYIDLDSFKPVNDQFGHTGGDHLLIEISRRLQGMLRAEDTLARLGGDEFVLLLSDLMHAEECFVVLERLLVAVRAPLLIEGVQVSISASVGVALSPPDEHDADVLLRHADQAMYRAKALGKNRYHVFDPAEDLQDKAHLHQLHRLEAALANGDFVLHYQPKVDLSCGDVIGVEALIRWQDGDAGLLPPAAFLHVLEGSELEIALGEWLIASVLAQMSRWREQGLRLTVSVNITSNHLLRPEFTARLSQMLGQHPQIRPTDLELEILETAAISDMKQAASVLDGCRQLGVRFALDDFGTGYSSLAYFRRLPIDVLKIDQSFVRDMLDDPADRDIVESVIRLAHAFDRAVIAEGVESMAHGALLLKMGCPHCQGYGIAHPMPGHELPAWITRWHENGAWKSADLFATAPGP